MTGEGDRKVKKRRSRGDSKNPHEWTRGWGSRRVKDTSDVESAAGKYMAFLNRARTEKECVEYLRGMLVETGFIDLERDGLAECGPGTGFLMVNRDRELIAGIAGTSSLLDGVNMVATHMDSPRLDLKPVPLDGDGDTGLGILRTHYYGGIKKYHWVNIPLSLRGRVTRADGGTLDIGREEDAPVFVIPDLLPHLAGKKQYGRKLSEGIEGEELVALAASGPLGEEGERQPVVEDILSYLNSRYGITEEDLTSSELCLVPEPPAREIGLDRGLIGSYGQDNRISCFCATMALLSMMEEKVRPKRWTLVANFDREEVGSEGNTGARSQFLELCIYRLLCWSGEQDRRRDLMRTLTNSACISADVKSGLNPTYKGVQDINNSARLGGGITITKYTGRGGKAGASDASAEFVGAIRKLYNENDVLWHMQETGKVDAGGGGTVAKFLASRNMDVLDNGIPLLSMHSPFEVSSKVDIYMGKKAFRTFLEGYSGQNTGRS